MITRAAAAPGGSAAPTSPEKAQWHYGEPIYPAIERAEGTRPADAVMLFWRLPLNEHD